MIEDEKLYLIALTQIEGMGDRRISYLINSYKSIKNIFEEKENSILNTLNNSSIKGKSVNIFSKNEALDRAHKIIEKSNNMGIDIITFFEETYPFNLKQIDNPPYLLYVKGNIKALRRNSISIVGTRNATESAMTYSFDISSKLSALNISVVSGLAKGVDTKAHIGALSTLGNTVAVLGNGIDVVYPPENIRVYEKIIEKGIIISEFATGTRPDRKNFPMRNRIISGLSYATIMVQAQEKSGALITVDYALAQGREVYIAPYDEKDSNFFGNHKLYKDGAKIINSVEDILEDFDYSFSCDNEYVKMKEKYFQGGIIIPKNNNKSNTTITSKIDKNIQQENIKKMESKKKEDYSNMNDDEIIIYKIIHKKNQIHIDGIIEMSKMTAQLVSTLLMQLELKGIIKQISGKYYKLEEI